MTPHSGAKDSSSSGASAQVGPRELTLEDYRELLAVPPPGVRLHSLDDGGIRGLSMLLLLRGLMAWVYEISGDSTLLCDYFDMIGGSGTGGFIALLLGRLRLSVDNAIICCTRFVERVLVRTKSDGTFKTAPFEGVLRDISDRFRECDDTPLQESGRIQCKTFVCTRRNDGRNFMAHKLRTYTHPIETYIPYTFIEAARATMGNPAFFERMNIAAAPNAKFSDAGGDHYSPVFDLYEEYLAIYPSRRMSYCLSLGPGRAQTIDSAPSPERCDSIAATFMQEHGDFDGLGGFYRMNLDQGIHDGTMARWEQKGILGKFTNEYL
ncbi:hypothetical protein BD626DRAFT_462611, partial [Schizophyllum amplum]